MSCRKCRPLFRGKRLLFVVNDPLFFLSHRLPLALAAKDAGLQVGVATPADRGWEQVRDAGLTFHPLRMSRWSTNPWSEMRALVSLTALYRSLRPDIVHHVTIKPVLYGSFAARLCAVPCVVNAVTGLGQVFSARGAGAHLRRALVLRIYRSALAVPGQRTITQNPEDAAMFVEKGMLSAERLVLIRGAGVDTTKFRPTPEPGGPPVVLFAGRLLVDKGIGEFAAAARTLRLTGCQARFLIAPVPADGNPGAVPPGDLESWHREGIIELLGHQREMWRLLRNVHIVCLPTYYCEGIPKILIEAAAAGRAIVTTDWPGCREIVRDGVNGLLVAPRDAEALAAALRKLISDAELRRSFGSAGRRIVLSDGYSETAVIEETLSVYEKCLRETQNIVQLPVHPEFEAGGAERRRTSSSL